MKIEVTQKHIDEGTPMNSKDCAIARAIKDVVGKDAEVAVSQFCYLVRMPDGREISVMTTPEMFGFISNFDRNKAEAKPFVFEMPQLSPMQNVKPRELMRVVKEGAFDSTTFVTKYYAWTQTMDVKPKMWEAHYTPMFTNTAV